MIEVGGGMAGGTAVRDGFEAGGEPPHDAVGAYLLDALPDDERRRFEEHLPTCPSCQRSVAELAPVAALLPRLDEAWSAGAADADLEPDPSLRDRIVAAAGIAADVSPTAPPLLRPAPAPLATVAAPPAPRSIWRRGTVAWPLAAVLALAAAGSLLWGLGQRQELIEQRAELAALRDRAAVYELARTDDAPPDAGGRLVTPGGQGDDSLLLVHGLPPLPPGRDYQVWFLENGQPRPAGTFEVDSQGQGGLVLETDPNAQVVALTEEPDGGSPGPTSPVLLAVEMEPAAG